MFYKIFLPSTESHTENMEKLRAEDILSGETPGTGCYDTEKKTALTVKETVFDDIRELIKID